MIEIVKARDFEVIKMQYDGPSENLDLMTRSYYSTQIHGTADTVVFDNQDWQVVNSKVNFVGNANTKWASLGASLERERLFFDANSQYVLHLKNVAEQVCAGKEIGDVLVTVNMLINLLTEVDGVSPLEVESGLDGRLDELLKEKRKALPDGAYIDIYFDDLAKEKILVCRHKGLLAASILAHLVEKNILPEGCVRQYRSSLKINDEIIGAHTWAVYRDAKTGDLWMCDPRWKTAKNVTKEFERLANAYGSPAMSDMVKRLNVEDRLHLIEEVVAAQQEQVSPSVPSTQTTDYDRWVEGKGGYQFGFYLRWATTPTPAKQPVENKPESQPAVLSNYTAWKQGKNGGRYKLGYGLRYLKDCVVGTSENSSIAPKVQLK